MKYLHILLLFTIHFIIASCSEKNAHTIKTEQELFDFKGNVKSASVTQVFHETNQNINIDTISFPFLPVDLLNKAQYDITFNKDQTIKSIHSSDSLYILTNIKINDSITHMLRYKNHAKSTRVSTSNSSEKTYQYIDENNKVIGSATLKIDTTNKIAIYSTFNNEGQLLKQTNFHYTPKCLIDRIDIKHYDLKYPGYEPIIATYHYEFDDKQSMISCQFEDLFGAVNKCEYKYIYDEKHNWIERVAFLNGEKVSTITRKIYYY